MNNTPFTIAQMRPIRDGMTVSRPAHLGAVPVTWFSLGAGTTITPESYDCTTLYIAAEGAGCFVLGDDARPTPICPGELLVLPPKTLCGAAADTGMIYTEIILKKENFTMNSLIKAGHPTALKDLISYEEGSIANLDVVHADNMYRPDPAPCPRQRYPDRAGRQGHHRLRGPGLRAERRREFPL